MREVAIVFWVVFAVAAVKAVHGTDPLSVFSALIAFGAAGTVTAKAGVTVKHDGTVGDQDLFRIVLAAAMAVAALMFVWAAMCADDLKRLLIAAAFAFGIAVVWSYAAGRRRVLAEHEERKRRATEQAAEAAARQRQEAEEREWQAAAGGRGTRMAGSGAGGGALPAGAGAAGRGRPDVPGQGAGAPVAGRFDEPTGDGAGRYGRRGG